MSCHNQRSEARRLARQNKSWLLKKKCEMCGSHSNLQMHHSDYSKPLEVDTLCRGCHDQIKAALKLLSSAFNNIQPSIRTFNQEK